MAWFDAVLLSVLPVLVVMSVLAVALPAARPARPWAGVGLAWLTMFVAGLVVAFANPDSWSLDCTFRIFRTSVTSGVGLGSRPCTGENELAAWLVALPPALGMGVLLAWVGRHTHPLALALRTAAVLPLLAFVVVGVGQLNPNLALLLVVVLIVAGYAWPLLREQVSPLKPAGPGGS